MTGSADRITAPFGANSSAAKVLEGVYPSGRRVIFADVSSVIGTETARALAVAGAEVIFVARNTEAGERGAADRFDDNDQQRRMTLRTREAR